MKNNPHKVSVLRNSFCFIFLLFAICILSGCSKEETGKKDKRPPYSIKIYRDNKLIFKGDKYAAAYGWHISNSKAFWSIDLIVVPKYPDDPNSTTIEVFKAFDDGTSLYINVKVAGGMYEGVAEDRKLISEKTYPVYPTSSDDPNDFLGIMFFYHGTTDDVRWTHKGGSHTITKKFVVTNTIKDDKGEINLSSDYINGKFSITYIDKSGEHTMTGEYKNLYIPY